MPRISELDVLVARLYRFHLRLYALHLQGAPHTRDAQRHQNLWKNLDCPQPNIHQLRPCRHRQFCGPQSKCVTTLRIQVHFNGNTSSLEPERLVRSSLLHLLSS
jgi:hypothetical protein